LLDGLAGAYSPRLGSRHDLNESPSRDSGPAEHMTDTASQPAPPASSSPTRRRWSFSLAEAVLIVVSILMAFAIDAWWDDRQEGARRIELLEALRDDFAATSVRLDPAIVEAEEDLALTSGYLAAVFEERDVTYDSLLVLFRGVTEAVFFQPSIPSYRTAISTGSLELVRSATLIAAMTEFDLQLGLYDLHLQIAGDLFYLEALQTFRQEVGSMDALGAPQGSALRALVPPDFDLRGRLAVATAEPTQRAQFNLLRSLRLMDEAAERIVAELDGILR